MKTLFFATAISASLVAQAHATDLLVDAAGLASLFTNVNQAMVVAVPGDRIFVMPGNYPAFQFSRGVEVVGMGTSPSQVVIARVDFHPVVPSNNFDAGLSNVTVCSAAPSDTISISGSELALGTLTLQGVVTCGGVYLRGGGSFYVMTVDCRFEPAPGTGFLGAAFTFGGGTADFVDSWIAGADASTAMSFPAGTGLRIEGGATVRVSNTHVSGGSGAASGMNVLQNAADAIEKGFGSAPPTLRLSGHSVVAGGSGGPTGVGGNGVDMLGNISVGQATVTGGSGTAAGLAYTFGQPLVLAHDPYLTMVPPKTFANGDTFFRPGQQVTVLAGDSLPTFALGYAYLIDPPTTALCSPLPPAATQIVNGQQLTLQASAAALTTATPVRASASAYPRRRMYLQGFFHDEISGAIVSTNPVAIMIAPN